MRRWQIWFFRPAVQLAFWVVVAVIGVLVVTRAQRRAVKGRRAWWHPEPVIVAPRDGAQSASSGSSVAPEGWTSVAKAVMPAAVNIATTDDRADSRPVLRAAENGTLGGSHHERPKLQPVALEELAQVAALLARRARGVGDVAAVLLHEPGEILPLEDVQRLSLRDLVRR